MRVQDGILLSVPVRTSSASIHSTLHFAPNLLLCMMLHTVFDQLPCIFTVIDLDSAWSTCNCNCKHFPPCIDR